MNVVIIKYNAGNNQSVAFALERLGITPIITDNPENIAGADRVIFPGVGEASSAMNYLVNNGLDKIIPTLRQPVLGICLGMQLLCKRSDENGTQCLEVFNTEVTKLPNNHKVPQVGWNTLHGMKGQLFEELPEDPYFYFVHSYAAGVCEHTVAISRYGVNFSSALQKGNFYGVQFHPEKSALNGETVLKNFIELT